MEAQEAIALLKTEFPAFAEAKEVILGDGKYWSFALRTDANILKVNLSSTRRIGLSLGLIGEPPLERYEETLATAIASLRQAAAEQMAALGLLAGQSNSPIKMTVYQGVIHGYSGIDYSPVYGDEAEAEKYIEGEEGYSVGTEEHEVVVSPKALAEQDKRTRHAIADAVAGHLQELGLELPGIDGVIMNCRGGLG